MAGNTKVLVVLDSKRYIGKEPWLKDQISQVCEPKFYFTDYENRLVKYFHGSMLFGNLFSHVLYWMISLNSALNLFVNNRYKGYNKLFVNPIVGVFYCFLLALVGSDERPTVAGFLFADKKNKLYLSLRKWFVRFSYMKSGKIVVYSREEIAFYEAIFPSLASKFKFIKYGRDYDIFAEKEYEVDDSYIASGGVSNRDFNTLACALEILEQEGVSLSCKIATRAGNYSLQCHPANLEVLHDIRIDAFGSFLSKALFVVIPLKDTSLSAGHMALLESMYRSKVIIVADIPAVRDYVDESNVFFYKPNDSYSLAGMIKYVWLNIASKDVLDLGMMAHERYCEEYSFVSFLKRLVSEAIAI